MGGPLAGTVSHMTYVGSVFQRHMWAEEIYLDKTSRV